MLDTPEPSAVKRALIEKYLRRDRSQTSTIVGDITRHAEAEPAILPEDVVPIQIGNKSKRPFFFLHGDWINGAYWCFPLAHEQGSDQPFYALDPFRFDGLPVSPSLETMAAAHLKSLRTVQPEGSYLLGGFCNGALLAYEMARQLHAESQKLDLLVLIDPMGLVYPAHNRLADGVISRIGDLMGLGQDKQLNGYILLRHFYNYLRFSHYRSSQDSRPWGADKQVDRWRRRNRIGYALSKLDAIFPTVEAIHQDYSAIYDWTAMRYVPPSLYPGKITFFWDSEEPWRRAGWRKAAETNEIEVHIIPGTQMECKTKYLHILAEHLRACLDKV